jgi:hypothetical protein
MNTNIDKHKIVDTATQYFKRGGLPIPVGKELIRVRIAGHTMMLKLEEVGRFDAQELEQLRKNPILMEMVLNSIQCTKLLQTIDFCQPIGNQIFSAHAYVLKCDSDCGWLMQEPGHTDRDLTHMNSEDMDGAFAMRLYALKVSRIFPARTTKEDTTEKPELTTGNLKAAIRGGNQEYKTKKYVPKSSTEQFRRQEKPAIGGKSDKRIRIDNDKRHDK